MAPTTLLSKAYNAVINFVAKRFLEFPSLTAALNFMAREKPSFYVNSEIPNEHYFNLKRAVENGLSYCPTGSLVKCPVCGVQASADDAGFEFMQSSTHVVFCRSTIEEKVILTHNTKSEIVQKNYEGKYGVAPTLVVSKPSTIRIGDFDVPLDGSAAKIVERHDTQRLLVLKAVTIGDADKGKTIQKPRSAGKKIWVPKWPKDDSIVDASTFDIYQEKDGRPDFIELLDDEDDNLTFEHIIASNQKGKGKVVVQTNRCIMNINALVKQTYEIARENNIPLEIVVKRRKPGRKMQTFYRVPLAHFYTDVGCAEDDIQDNILRHFVNSEYFSEQVKRLPAKMVCSKIIRPGWSGCALHRNYVLDPWNFEFNEHDICVIKGVSVRGQVLSALNRHTDDDILFYCNDNADEPTFNVGVSSQLDIFEEWNDGVHADHAPEYEELKRFHYLVLHTYLNLPHVCCRVCYMKLSDPASASFGFNIENANKARAISRRLLFATHNNALEHIIEAFQRSQPQQRTLIQAFSNYNDPRIQGLANMLVEQMHVLVNVQESLNVLSAEMAQHAKRPIVVECSQKLQRTLDTQSALSTSLSGIEEHLKQLNVEVDNWLTTPMHVPKFGLDVLQDDDGNPVHHDGKNAIKQLLAIPGVAREISKTQKEEELSKWDMIGPDGGRIWTCATLLRQNANVDLERYMRSCRKVEQHNDHCGITFDGVARIGCTKKSGKIFSTASIMPMLNHIRFGDLAHNHTVPFNFERPLSCFVVENGFCYINCFLSMLQFIPERQVPAFIRSCEKAVAHLGAWPTLGALSRVVFEFCLHYQTVCNAPVPVMIVGHVMKVVHFIGQCGVGDYGFHQLNFITFQEWFDLNHYLNSSPFAQYRAGGIVQDVSKAIKSKEGFLEFVTEDPTRFIDALLHPSCVYALSIAQERHGMITKLLEQEERMVPLLAKLNLLGKYYHIFDDVNSVVARFVGTNKSLEHELEQAFGRSVSDAFCVRMAAIIEQHLETNTMAILDRVLEKNQTLQQREENMRIIMRAVLREELSFFEFVRIGARFKYDRWCHGTGAHTIQSGIGWLQQRRSEVRDSVLTVCKKPLALIKARTARFAVCTIVQNFLPYYAVLTACAGLLTLCFRLAKYVRKMALASTDVNKVVYESKKTTGKVTAQFMALAAIITAFFNTDLSDQWYSCMLKFKNIMSTLFDEYVTYEAGETNQLELDPVRFIEFALAEDAPGITCEREATFRKWREAKEQTVGLGTLPTTQGVKFMLHKNNIESIACKLSDSPNSEFLVVGKVGCGKSTKFVSALSSLGKVLLLEPTRALVSNVEEGLLKVCNVDATVRMRFYNKYGTQPVTVMTYGFALNWFANGCEPIGDYSFVVFDECHIVSADMIVLYNWIKSKNPTEKIIKMSATPLNNVTEYVPECPVEVINAPQTSCQQFVEAQGRGTICDATRHGRVILIFVASYTDVDRLAEGLRGKNFGVVKADGRTLRNAPKLSERISEQSQQHVFVVATNAIENGVTLDVDVVVDFGEKIIADLDSDMRYIGTKRVKISKGERVQRLGRVGRFKPGVAIKMGTLDASGYELDTLTATEAALKSFAFNTPPCLLNVDTSILDGLTKSQVRTACEFELDAIYMSHFVRSDGKMPKAVFNEFKGLLLRDVCVHTTEKYHANIASLGWKTISQYGAEGKTQLDTIQHVPIPFHSYTISDEGLIKIAQAVKASDPGRGRNIQLPASKLYEATHKITCDESKIPGILSIIEALKVQEQMKLDNLRTNASVCSSQSLLNILNMNFLANKDRLEQQYRKNITLLTEVEQQIKSVPEGTTNTDLINFLRENPLTAQCVLFEGDVSKQIEIDILGKKRFTNAQLVLPCVLGLIVVCCVYIYYTAAASNDVVAYEAKNKKLRYRRDKRGTMSFYHDHDGEFENDFGSAYDRRRSKSGRGTVLPRGQKNHAFKYFYDFDVDAFDIVKFIDPETRAVVERTPYAIDMEDVVNDLEAINAELIDDARWGDCPPEKVHAYFLRKGDSDAFFVEMTQHNSRQVSRKNTTLPVGFPEKDGQMRQSGEPKRVSMDELARAGVVTQQEVVRFESAGTVQGPFSLEFLQHYLIKVDNGLGNLSGFGFGQHVCVNAHLFGSEDEHAQKKNFIVDCKFGRLDYGDAKQIKYHQIHNTDLAIVKIPFDAPKFKSKLLLRPPRNGEQAFMVTPVITANGVSYKSSMPSIISYDKSQGNNWKHFITTNKGSCGSLMIAVCDKAVVGLHSLGLVLKVGWNYFAPVTDEMVKALKEGCVDYPNLCFDSSMVDNGDLSVFNGISNFPLVRKVREMVSYQGDTYGSKFCGGNLVKIAELTRPMNFKHVVKGCRQSYLDFIHNNPEFIWAVPYLGNRMPTVLSVESFYQDIIKYDSPVVVGRANYAAANEAFSYLVRILEASGFRKHSLPFVWDVNEVVADMNLDAAMGACYHGKKKEWFGSIDESKLIAAHKESLERLYHGRKGVWTGSLKAELRPKEKVLAKKTRVFTAAPVDVLLGAKTLVDAFNHQFYANHTQGPWTVGINKFALGWEKLAQRFRNDWQFIDADGSQYDSSLSPYLFDMVFRIRTLFMEKDELGISLLRNLYAQIVYTPISTVDGNVIVKHKGNNSGQPSTVVDNTLILIFVMEYARIMGSEGLNGLMRFTYVANGDDLLINAPAEEASIIRTAFPTYFSHFGLKYDFSNVCGNIEDVEYMSCKFVTYKGHIIPKLSTGRILSIMEWERNEDLDAQLSALNAARIEAWGDEKAFALADNFIKYFANVHNLKEYFYLPTEFIEKLYLNEIDEVREFLETQKHLVEYEIDRGLPVRETVAGFEPPVEGESQTNRRAREARNEERYQAALADYERRQKGGNDGATEDIPEGSTGPAFMLPRPPNRSVWIPPVLQSRINQNTVNQLLRYKPDQMLMRADVAPQVTLTAWFEGLQRDLQLQPAEVNSVVQSFMVWCINSGTSQQAMNQDGWQADDGNGGTMLYQLRPFIQNAGKSLRSIMRNLSPIAEAWLKERNKTGTYISAWASKAGLTDKQYAHVGFDFWVPQQNNTHQEIHMHSLMTEAHLRGTTVRNLAMANIHRGDNETPDYHVGGRRPSWTPQREGCA
ncbi:polyprotein [Stylosanthes mosaic-associated virus 3]|nr:polyprotein [Stylosanthes mosaic-associated virus 3]